MSARQGQVGGQFRPSDTRHVYGPEITRLEDAPLFRGSGDECPLGLDGRPPPTSATWHVGQARLHRQRHERHPGRTPRGWSVKGAVGCVRFRRVKDGVMVKRANGAQNLSVHRLIPRQTPPDPGLALDGRG
jgi:hypothetical protein